MYLLYLLTAPYELWRGFSHHLCRWLGLPHSLSRIALYGDNNKLMTHAREMLTQNALRLALKGELEEI